MQTPSRYDTLVLSYARLVIRFRWWFVLGGLVAFAGMAAGLKDFVFDESYRVFFAEDNPELVAFDRVQDTFSKNDSVYFIVTPPDGEVFTRETLAAVEDLTEGGWLLPHAIRVDSITNFQHTRALQDDILVGPLVEDVETASEQELAEARYIALDEPYLRDRLINGEGSVTGVNVTIHLPEEEPGEAIPVVEAARELRDRVMADHPGVEIGLTGLLPLNHAFLEATQIDAQTIVPVMVLLIVVTMMWLLRSVLLMLATMLVVCFAMFGGLGMATWMGVSFSGPSSSSPIMIMTLAVADSIHVLVSMLFFMRGGHSKNAALVESIRVNMTPIFLTSLTTCIGFLSMNINSVPPIADLGNTTATGVAIAYLFSVTFLPALVAILPIRPPRSNESTRTRKGMLALAEWVLRWRRPVFWCSLALAAAIGAGIFRIPINNQFVDWFDESIPIRRDTDYAMEQLTGIYVLSFVLEAEEPGGVSDPEYLAKLDAFTEWVVSLPEVNHASSIADIMKRLNQSFNGDDPAYYRLPDSRELAAQYLLVYELSLPQGLDLTTQINLDKSATRVDVTVRNLRSEEILVLADEIEAWMEKNLPPHMRSEAFGPPIMFAHISDKMMDNLWASSPVALLFVSLALLFALRSFKLGVLSIIPNLMPIAMAFGMWGLLHWDMNFSMGGIMAMGLGIVVDDTVHFMSKYLRARRVQQLGSEDAVRYAFGSVGVALWVTSFVLMAGFLFLTLSNFQFTFNMGFMTAMVIGFALAGDLLFLPTLLLLIDPAEGERTLEDFERDQEALLNEEEEFVSDV